MADGDLDILDAEGPQDRPAGTGAPAWVMVAGGAGIVVAGLGLFALLGRGAASDEAEAEDAIETCQAIAPLPPRFPGEGPWIDLSNDPEVEQEVVLELPAAPESRLVVFLGPDQFLTCRYDRSVATMAGSGQGSWDRPPPDEVTVLVNSWTSTQAGGPSSWSLTALGRVGDAVEAVWVEVPGTRLDALIADGWFTVEGEFFADARFPPDETLDSVMVGWRLAGGGSVAFRSLGQLLTQTSVQRCAADPGCVDARLAELQAEAGAEGRSSQAQAMADGRIDDGELRAGVAATVDCMLEAGLAVDPILDGHGYHLRRRPDEAAETSGTERRCRGQHLDLIGELYRLRLGTSR